ncbi:serine protease [Geodermatophilus sp. SYSU D00710]
MRQADVVEVLGEVEASDGSRKHTYGSGYRISTHLILTSAHVLALPEERGHYIVRGGAGSRSSKASPILLSPEGADIAVLKLADGHGWEPIETPRFGLLVDDEGFVPFEMIGWPRGAEIRNRRDTVQLAGRVSLGSSVKSGLLKLFLDGPTPVYETSSQDPWLGFSGAAVFCRSVLVGVVKQHHIALGIDQLDAEPVASLEDEPEFTALFANQERPSAFLRIHGDIPVEERGPSLETRLARAGSASLTNFRSRQTPFVGRGHEIGQLRTLLEDRRSFAWQVVTGAGGSGKSRLALELCIAAQEAGWQAGFLVPDRAFSWENWYPSRPTLIVIDEVEYNVQAAKLAIRVLSEREEYLPQRVRVLLLGRERATRVESILGVEPSVWETFFVETQPYDPIALAPLVREDAEILAASVPGVEKLIQLPSDPSVGLPLYTVLAAIAGASLGRWDATLATRYILNRNRISYWKDMKDSDELALAYACISRDPTARLAAEGVIADVGWDELVRRNHKWTGTDGVGLTSLEPGPVAELYVLDLMARANTPAGTDDTGHRAASVAFALNSFANEFVLRSFVHYPAHPGLPRLLAAMVAEFDRSFPQVWSWGGAILHDSAADYAAEGDITLALAELDAMCLLRERGEFASLMSSPAQVAFTVLTVSAENEYWHNADLSLDRLDLIASSWPGDAQYVGRGYSNYVILASKAGGQEARVLDGYKRLMKKLYDLGSVLAPYAADALQNAVSAEESCEKALQLLRDVLGRPELLIDNDGQIEVLPGSDRQIAYGLFGAAFNVANRAGREGRPQCGLEALNILNELGEHVATDDPDWVVDRMGSALMSIGVSVKDAAEDDARRVLSVLADYYARSRSGSSPELRMKVFVALSNYIYSTELAGSALAALNLLCGLQGTFESTWNAAEVCLLRGARVVSLGADVDEVRELLARTVPASLREDLVITGPDEHAKYRDEIFALRQ